MARDAELTRLGEDQKKAFDKQQKSYQELKSTGELRSRIKTELDESWRKVQESRSVMDEAYRKNQRDWDYYKSQRESISREIEYAKSRADSLHSQMSAAFDRASSSYNYGDKSSAPIYAAEGRRYKTELFSANAEVKNLIARAKSLICPGDSFKSYQMAFKSAQSEHRLIQNRYASAKADHELAKERFKKAKKECFLATEAFRDRLNTLKAEKASREEKNRSVLMVVNPEVAFMDGKQVKFKPRNDGSGKTDIYFGGILGVDSYGHGHIVIDDCSNIIYMRQQFKDKKDSSQIDIDQDRGIVNI